MHEGWGRLCVHVGWGRLCVHVGWKRLCVHEGWGRSCVYVRLGSGGVRWSCVGQCGPNLWGLAFLVCTWGCGGM